MTSARISSINGFFNSREDMERIFAEQLEQTGAGYFDYYLLHGIEAGSLPKYEQFDCFGWLLEKKARGLVKHAGFSFHDSPELLDDILKHNAQDIASLCVLLNHMAHLYLHPEEIRFSEDVYSMGRALERVNQTEHARRCYRLAERGRMGELASSALAVSYRRSGEREEAAEIWRQMIREGRGGTGPYVELAKYEEHIRRDYAAALSLTEQAMIRLSEPGLGQDETVQETQNELQYRRQRLLRKLKER